MGHWLNPRLPLPFFALAAQAKVGKARFLLKRNGEGYDCHWILWHWDRLFPRNCRSHIHFQRASLRRAKCVQNKDNNYPSLVQRRKKEFEFRSWNFDPACVVRRITINKLNFVPEWLMSGVVVVLWNGGGLGMLWITTTISRAHKLGRCTVIKCLRRGLVFYPGKSNGCCCRGFLVFQVSSKIRTMILLDALTFFLILWLNPWYLSEYLHLPVLLTHLTFLPQSLLQSVDLHGPSTEPYKCGILLP